MQIKKFKPTDHKVKAVIYGASGSGKTVFGATAPKPIFASAEAGLLSVADKNIDYVEIKTINDLQELLMYLKTQKHDFETVVIDSITEINDIIKMDIEKRTGKSMQLNDWGELGKRIRNIFRSFRDLPLHVIFLAQETVELDDGTVVKVTPSLNGKAATEISYFMDNVGYLYIDKTGERKMITNPSAKFLTKNRGGIIGNETEVNFSVWVEKAKAIKIGTEKITANFDLNFDAKTGEPIPPAIVEPMIEETTLKELHASWRELWNLSMQKLPDQNDTHGQKLYTEEKLDQIRHKTIEGKFSVGSAKDLTQKQAKEFCKSCKDRIIELKKLPDPKTVVTASQPEAETLVSVAEKMFSDTESEPPFGE